MPFFIPKQGQWILIKLKNPDKHERLITQYCACSSHSGELVAIYSPPDLVLVDNDGHNIADADQNDISFSLISPIISDMRPLINVKDLPPRRVFSSHWLEAFSGRKLDEYVRKQYNYEMTPEMFLDEAV